MQLYAALRCRTDSCYVLTCYEASSISSMVPPTRRQSSLGIFHSVCLSRGGSSSHPTLYSATAQIRQGRRAGFNNQIHAGKRRALESINRCNFVYSQNCRTQEAARKASPIEIDLQRVLDSSELSRY